LKEENLDDNTALEGILLISIVPLKN